MLSEKLTTFEKVAAAFLAKELTPHIGMISDQSASPSVCITPNSSLISEQASSYSTTDLSFENATGATASDSCVVDTEVEEELIPSSIMTQLFVKSCSRRNFAVWLVRELFDEQTRIHSNVA